MKKIPILVVEDDADLAESLFDCLRLEGWDPTVASTGREGLAEFKKRNFEVVVTDFRLPEMGGMDLLQSLREISPGTPVILMTAHGTTALAIEATQKGAFDYLIKPSNHANCSIPWSVPCRLPACPAGRFPWVGYLRTRAAGTP